jgi:hypothetical protein
MWRRSSGLPIGPCSGKTIQHFARALDLEPLLVPRERVLELRWLLEASPDEEAPPLTGGSWDD